MRRNELNMSKFTIFPFPHKEKECQRLLRRIINKNLSLKGLLNLLQLVVLRYIGGIRILCKSLMIKLGRIWKKLLFQWQNKHSEQSELLINKYYFIYFMIYICMLEDYSF